MLNTFKIYRTLLQIRMSRELLQWKKVILNPQNRMQPSQRWGHALVRVGDNELVMYGGFGQTNDGKYLEDIWSFKLNTFSWNKIQTTGQKPLKRSNYTIHYDEQKEQIILFGGGSENKQRYNTISVLDWKTKNWTEIIPNEFEQRPWERTYHSSVYIHQYLIIFGGESLANIDLNDLWVFNMQTKKWKQIMFKQQSQMPNKRRFHSSVFLDGYFYVLGGCFGSQYHLNSDMYRVNLTRLFEKEEFDDFQWEKLLQNNKMLQRWGHSSTIYENKIYIACGRINQVSDTNDMHVFDPVSLSLSQVQISKEHGIKARRRHSAVMVGNSLIVFGGYNGSYLKDMYFISLPSAKAYKTQKYTIKQASISQINSELKRVQSNNKEIRINIKLQKSTFSLGTIEEKLKQNVFFEQLTKYNKENSQIQLFLPKFIERFEFELFHAALCHKLIYVNEKFSFNFLLNLLKTADYFCENEFIQALQPQMIKRLDEQNSAQFLCTEISHYLPNMRVKAAEKILNKYFDNIECNRSQSKVCLQSNELDDQIYKNTNSSTRSTINEEETDRIKSFLTSVYTHKKFDLQQAKMRQENGNFVAKIANKVRKLFYDEKNQNSQNRPAERQVTCFSQIIQFFSRLCRRGLKTNRSQRSQ